MEAVFVVAAVGLITYLLRAGVLFVVDRRGLPRIVERAGAVAMPVSFAGLAAVRLAPHAELAPAALPPLLAVGVTFVAARRTGSANAGLALGLAVLWPASTLLGS